MIEPAKRRPIAFLRIAFLLLGAVLVLIGCAVATPGVSQAPTPVVESEQAVATVDEVATQSPVSTPVPVLPTEVPPTVAATPIAAVAKRPPPPVGASTGSTQLIDRGTSGRMEVALTFDAGAERGYAVEILDVLAANGVKASFGITGHWAEEHPDLVRRIVAEGHMVFNHTWSHSSFTGFSPGTAPLTKEQRYAEIADTEVIIRELTGYETAPYFRPPYGDLDAGAMVDIAGAGYPLTIMWSCDSNGWNSFTAAEIIAHCGQTAQPGAIILMHVHPLSDLEALPGMIETLQAQGYALVTVETLIQP
ncbi:MAG: polysaccharide deacetylase family protein [Chloroflexia bacterium]|nr:polysaccharide deacetylase family protein [Chloroflexia bacterium]